MRIRLHEIHWPDGSRSLLWLNAVGRLLTVEGFTALRLVAGKNDRPRWKVIREDA